MVSVGRCLLSFSCFFVSGLYCFWFSVPHPTELLSNGMQGLCFSRSSSSSSCVVASLFCFFFFLLVLLRHAQIELSQAHTYMVLLGCSFSLEKKQFPFFFCSDVPDGVCLFLSEYRTLFLSPFLSTCRKDLGEITICYST
jgi:hypothetical protein